MFDQGEIVLVPFPYSDLSGAKRRPVLVVSNNDYNNAFSDVVVAVITSKTNKPDKYSIPISGADLQIGFLPAPSLIRIHKLFTIDQSRILKRFSKLSEKKLKETLVQLWEVFDSPILKNA